MAWLKNVEKWWKIQEVNQSSLTINALESDHLATHCPVSSLSMQLHPYSVGCWPRRERHFKRIPPSPVVSQQNKSQRFFFFPFNYNSSTRKKASQQTNHVSGHLSALCLVLRTPLMPEDSPKPKWPPRKGTAAPPQWPRMFCDSMTGRKCLDKAAAIQLKHG